MAYPDYSTPDSDVPSRNPRKAAWKRGDRVLAPWEPTFLYAGTVEQIKGAKTLIQFDDGDSGWVEMALVQPLALKPGQRVMSRRRMGPHFFPGEISEVEGENVHIEFDDGKEERTTVAALRIPCKPKGRGAEQVEARSFMAFLEHLQEGDRVWALWDDSALFPGSVSELRNQKALVLFDDGDQAWVKYEHLLPLDLIVGMFVMSRKRMGTQFYPGAITDTEGDRVQIRYDDGDEEWTTAAALALPLQPPSTTSPAGDSGRAAAARPVPPRPTTSSAEDPETPVVGQGWNPVTVLIVGGLVLAVVAGLFFWLGQR